MPGFPNLGCLFTGGYVVHQQHSVLSEVQLPRSDQVHPPPPALEPVPAQRRPVRVDHQPWAQLGALPHHPGGGGVLLPRAQHVHAPSVRGGEAEQKAQSQVQEVASATSELAFVTL